MTRQPDQHSATKGAHILHTRKTAYGCIDIVFRANGKTLNRTNPDVADSMMVGFELENAAAQTEQKFVC